MDAQNIVTAFVASANQYAVSPTENNLMNLQRHLEILLCLTCTDTDYFRNCNPLASQCITHITNILLDSNVKITLIPRILSIIQNLLKDSSMRNQLQSTFHVHSAIFVFLQNYGTDMKDCFVHQCFLILQNITYGISIDYIESHFENIINVLLQIIDQDSSQMLNLALHILSNVCRHNIKVQSYICGLPNVKQITKKLVSMLRKQEPHIVVYVLSILASLTPCNSLMAKLWTDEHLKMTFELVLKLLFDKDDNCALAALDLFLDLTKIPRYQSYVAHSSLMKWCLKKISKKLSTESLEDLELYLKFLSSLTSMPDVCEKVCSILCLSAENNANFEGQTVLDIHPVLVKACTDYTKENKLCNISLKIFKAIINCNHNKFYSIKNSVMGILQKMLESMSALGTAQNNSMVKEQVDAMKTMFEILLLLFEETSLKESMLQYINPYNWADLAKVLLDMGNMEDGNSDYTIDTFLLIIQAFSVVKNSSQEFLDCFDTILKDTRTMQIAAYAMTSTNVNRINSALALITLSKQEGHLNVLGENLSMRNLNIQQRLFQNSDFPDSLSGSSDVAPQNSRKILYSAREYSPDNTIDSILSKIENGLNVKDLKRSEIMDLYEHKVALLTRKEKELQNYVEAKTAALQEADRVMIQIKCRQADADYEALTLRNMLKDLECRFENTSQELEQHQMHQKKLVKDLETSGQMIAVLQKNLSDEKEFMQTQTTRFSDQKKLLEDEKAKLIEQNTLKEQEKKNLRNQIQQCEEELKAKHKVCQDLEECNDELEKILNETKKSMEKLKLNFEQKQLNLENAIDLAEQKIASLEEKNESLAIEMAEKEDDFTHKISALMIKNAELDETLKCRDLKIADMNDSIGKLKQSLNSKCSEVSDLTKCNEELQSIIEEAENAKEKLSKEVEMLKLLCKRYEKSIDKKEHELKNVKAELAKTIEEKGDRIKHLEDELEKHTYITTMIHQMTSGKGVPPKT